MTIETYPDTLPSPMTGTLNEDYDDGTVEDSGEIGPPRKRVRTTRSLGYWSFTLRLVGTQKSTWDTFYRTTLNRGVSPFYWTLLGTTYTVQVIGKPKTVHVGGDSWNIDLQFGEV